MDQLSFSARTQAWLSLGLLLASLLSGCASVENASTARPATASLSLSASSFNFQTVVVGQSSTQTLTLTNTGSAALQISSLTVSNSAFTLTGPSFPRSLVPAASLSYTITFAPTSSGSASATLNILTGLSSTPTAVALAGTGESAFANLAFSPASVNFGNLTVQTTATQNVTIQNTGDISLTIQGVTVAGAGFAYSALSAGVSLAPNQQLTFQVSFTPKTAGPASATLSFLSPNLSSPATLSLAGDGVTSTSPTSPSSPTQQTVTLNWTASTSQVTGYNVYRSVVSGSSYSLLTSSPVAAVTYADSTVSSGTTYYYVVTAVNSDGEESAYSNQATAAVPSS